MITELLNLELTAILLVRRKKNSELSGKATSEYSVPLRKRGDTVLPGRGQCLWYLQT